MENRSTFSALYTNNLFAGGISTSCAVVRNDMLNDLLKVKQGKPTHPAKYFYKINFLYKHFHYNDSVLSETLPDLISLLIMTNQMDLFLPYTAQPSYLNTIRKIDKRSYPFLHEAIQVYDEENKAFDSLISLLDKDFRYDQYGNSLLHVCKNPASFGRALEFTEDINRVNRLGNTPLHEAALRNNIDKARFLLMQGADPDIRNKRGYTFWTIKSRDTSDLHVYRYYKQNGDVLSLPPRIVEQQGPNCGFYAVDCAATYHRHRLPYLFHKPALPARKRDVNYNTSQSLRQLRHELGIKGPGGIFSVTDLQKVIKKTECKSLVCDIFNYEHFLNVIKAGIRHNLPIIIPFSSDEDGGPNLSYDASKAHWATVIGWAGDRVNSHTLLAECGKYVQTNAKELFEVFYNVQPVYPETQYFKIIGFEWRVAQKTMKKNNVRKVQTVPETDLKDFRRKLVMVLPPKFDCSLLNEFVEQEAIAGMSTSGSIHDEKLANDVRIT